MFRSPHKPTSPPPPPPRERRAGANVDVDGKRSRLPGDTVRQVVTPGRIKNLASLFDQQTQKPNEITPSRRPRSARRVTTDEFFTPTGLSPELNNNLKKGPPRKPIRSFAAQLILEEEDVVTEEDFDQKNERTFSVSTERSINDEEYVAIVEEIVDQVIEEVIIPPGEDLVKLEEKLRDEIRIEAEEERAQMDELREKIQLENEISTTKDEAFVTAEDAVPAMTGDVDKTPKVSMLNADSIPRIMPARRTRTLSRVDEFLDDQRLLVMPVPRSRTVSQGDDQQSVNGHIDNLFDFVDEHLSSKQSRSSRECVFQPHFSPSAIPNVAELSQDLTIGPQVKSNNSSKRVGSALATSTPQNSPRSTAHNPSRLLEGDVSFVSSIQDVSQTEAVGQYEQMIMKNEHALDRNNQQIAMLLKALAHARKERKPMQEVSAQKSLLMARERVVLLQRENKRLKALVACRRPIPNQCLEVRGSLTISNVAVHLNRNFYTKPYEMVTNFSFLVMLKCGCEVECTATHNLLAHQSSRLKVVHFDEKINFCNLPVDFCVMLEVYAMAIPEKEAGVTCASIIASKCRNLLPKERTPTTSPSGFPYGEFVRCGYVQLTRDTTGTNKFYLDEVEYPLDGTIEITTHCTTLPPAIAIDHEGFLTMYQCISGMSSWERYWAVLRRGTILFWKYPEDERLNKAAKARLDLSTCSQFEVHPCSVEQCPRPHTFAVNVLVNTAPSVMDKKRIFLAADSRCEMKNWLDNINETLAVLRGNHPYKGSILPRS